jgi:hypothetical protein
MMKIVLAAGYHGYVGIEYEGSKIDEYAGIRADEETAGCDSRGAREAVV